MAGQHENIRSDICTAGRVYDAATHAVFRERGAVGLVVRRRTRAPPWGGTPYLHIQRPSGTCIAFSDGLFMVRRGSVEPSVECVAQPRMRFFGDAGGGIGDAAERACAALGRHTLRQRRRPSPPTRGCRF